MQFVYAFSLLALGTIIGFVFERTHTLQQLNRNAMRQLGQNVARDLETAQMLADVAEKMEQGVPYKQIISDMPEKLKKRYKFYKNTRKDR